MLLMASVKSTIDFLHAAGDRNIRRIGRADVLVFDPCFNNLGRARRRRRENTGSGHLHTEVHEYVAPRPWLGGAPKPVKAGKQRMAEWKISVHAVALSNRNTQQLGEPDEFAFAPARVTSEPTVMTGFLASIKAFAVASIKSGLGCISAGIVNRLCG